MEKSISDRIEFVQAEKLCFGCLKLGHFSKICKSRSICDIFHKMYPTCLHKERIKENLKLLPAKSSTSEERHRERPPSIQPKEITTVVTSNRVIIDETSMQTAAIIPVWISSITQTAQEFLVYTLLDSQSDTTFILNEVAEALDANK